MTVDRATAKREPFLRGVCALFGLLLAASASCLPVMGADLDARVSELEADHDPVDQISPA